MIGLNHPAEEWLPEAILKQKSPNRYRPSRKAPRFTSRELQVMSLIADGKTTKEIASTLALSTETVGTYRKSICRKLNVHSTAELVQKAVTFQAGRPGHSAA